MIPNAFNSPERNKFYYNSVLPFWDTRVGIGKYSIARPYALYACYQVPEKLIKQIKTGSVMAAQVFSRVSKLLSKETSTTLSVLGYSEKFQHILKFPTEDMFCMRIAWSVSGSKIKLIETNTERPVFWIESEEANGQIAKHFGKKDPNPETKNLLIKSLDQAIERAFSFHKIQLTNESRVGYVVPQNSEDYQTLRWLSEQSSYDGEVLTITNLDFDKKTKIPFNRVNGRKLDAIFCWYPIEEMSELSFNNGEKFDKVFFDALEHKSFILIHELAAFKSQPKSILAYITERRQDIFVGDLSPAQEYFPETYLNLDMLGNNYFAKPVWGRAGRGCTKMKNGEVSYGKCQEHYYNKQPKVYQELLEFPTVDIDNKSLSLVYEAWVYNVDNSWVAGAVGIRASENTITDDFGYFLPIGISNK